MRFLKQSTSVDLPIGPFVDATDGFTAETALTITQPDVRLKKNAAAWGQKAAAQTLSHEENGYYEVTLDATDTDTLGHLRLAVNETGALPIWEEFMVMSANVWDSLFGSAKLLVDASASLSVDTYAQPGQEAPPATTTLAKMMAYLYKGFRNRLTQDATEAKLYADDAITVDQKASVSDDGVTFDRGEFGSGP